MADELADRASSIPADVHVVEQREETIGEALCMWISTGQESFRDLHRELQQEGSGVPAVESYPSPGSDCRLACTLRYSRCCNEITPHLIKMSVDELSEDYQIDISKRRTRSLLSYLLLVCSELRPPHAGWTQFVWESLHQ